MKPPRDPQRIADMLAHAREAVAMAADCSREDLDTDRMRQLALVRLVEIIGEAAARVSPEGQLQWPTIPWGPARGMRNRLIHGYDSVDLDVLWDTLQLDLPALIVQLDEITES